MYKIRKLDYPKFKSYVGKKGCTIKPDRRSFTCLFYSCEGYPLVYILKDLWLQIMDNIDNTVIDGKNEDLYNSFNLISYILTEINNKYNPLIEIDKKLLDNNTMNHLTNFRSLSSGTVFNQKIQDSLGYIIRLLEESLKKKKVIK